MVFAGITYICGVMSDFKNITDFFTQVIERLNGTQERRAVEVASDLRAQVQNRIITTGTDADGNNFPAYSTQYKKTRKDKGRQTDHVDLFFSGQMWRGTGLEVTKSILYSTTVAIRGKNADAANKIDWNSARYGGSILEPSEAEIAAATRKYGEVTLKAIRFQ